MVDIKSIKKDIQENKENLLTSKREVMEKNTQCMTLIRKEKEDRIKMISEVYDKLLEEANEQNSKFSLNIDGKVSFLEEKIAMLDNIEENVNYIKITNDDITNNMETIQTITQEFKTGSHIDAKIHQVFSKQRSQYGNRGGIMWSIGVRQLDGSR